MTELMSFDEFLKENEKTAKTYARQYVEGEYRRKYREEAKKKNPDLKKNQLGKMTASAVESFKKSPDFEKLVAQRRVSSPPLGEKGKKGRGRRRKKSFFR